MDYGYGPPDRGMVHVAVQAQQSASPTDGRAFGCDCRVLAAAAPRPGASSSRPGLQHRAPVQKSMALIVHCVLS